ENRERTSEEMAGTADASGLKQLANMAAGNRLAAQCHLFKHPDSEAHLASKFAQGLDVAGGVVSEMEVVAFMDLNCAQLFPQDAVDKLARREQREIATEREQEDRVEPDSLEQAKLLWGRGQQFQAGIGAQDASRMRFKGDSHGFRLLRACAAHDVGQNGLVRSVD